MEYLRDEFHKGLGMAADPANANLPDLAVRITTIHSPWFAQTCSVCKFKFREGDRVRLCPKCKKPFHDDDQYHLNCWNTYFKPGKICTEGGVDRFSEAKRKISPCDFTFSGSLPETGLTTPRADVSGQPRVSPDTLLVDQFMAGLKQIWRPFGEQKVVKVRPGSPAIGRNCPWCRFRIRESDWVVECPCGCGTFFHEDVFRHLTCWNEWNGVEGNEYCPNTGKSYKNEEDGNGDA